MKQHGSHPHDTDKVKSILEFEERTKNIAHNKCVVCLAVGLTLSGKHMPSRGGFTCDQCKFLGVGTRPRLMPTWTETDTGKIRFDVPPELSSLTEGEKLLIQIVSPYVPLQHLRKGAFGCHGHVCSKRAWMQHLKGNTRQFHLSPQETSLVERWSSTLVP